MKPSIFIPFPFQRMTRFKLSLTVCRITNPTDGVSKTIIHTLSFHLCISQGGRQAGRARACTSHPLHNRQPDPYTTQSPAHSPAKSQPEGSKWKSSPTKSALLTSQIQTHLRTQSSTQHKALWARIISITSSQWKILEVIGMAVKMLRRVGLFIQSFLHWRVLFYLLVMMRFRSIMNEMLKKQSRWCICPLNLWFWYTYDFGQWMRHPWRWMEYFCPSL